MKNTTCFHEHLINKYLVSKKNLLFSFFIASLLSQAQVSLVKDINTSLGNSGNGVALYPNNRIAFNNHLIFAATDGPALATDKGMELWITDGTANGTTLIKDIRSGLASSNPKNFIVWQNQLIFTADQNGNQSGGNNLFKSDLTEIGTINMASGINFYTAPFVFNDNLYIGRESFYSAQTTTAPVNSTFLPIPTATPSDPPTYLGIINNELIFKHPATFLNGSELWKTDFNFSGTSLIKDINPGNATSSPSDFVLFNNKGYFTADDGTNGRELWVTDGTTAGTNIVLDLFAGATGSNPNNLTIYNNALYFTADHPTLGREIFKMTISETITNLRNIASGNASSNPQNLFVFNDVLYFSADDGINGNELWVSEGFPSNTILLKNINTSPSSPDSNPSGFTEYFGELFFAADDGVNGRELWKTDGTSVGTVLVSDINPSGNSNPSDFIVANNLLFFSANDGTTGIELWKYQEPSLSIEDNIEPFDTSIYPNPTSKGFSIESKHQITNVSIYDIHGKLLKSYSGDNRYYNIETLNAGIYFLNIETVNGTFTQKLIKK